MAAETRVYAARTQDGKLRLIRSTHRNHVVWHLAKDTIQVRVATQDDLIENRTVEVETIGQEQHDLPLS